MKFTSKVAGAEVEYEFKERITIAEFNRAKKFYFIVEDDAKFTYDIDKANESFEEFKSQFLVNPSALPKFEDLTRVEFLEVAKNFWKTRLAETELQKLSEDSKDSKTSV